MWHSSSSEEASICFNPKPTLFSERIRVRICRSSAAENDSTSSVAVCEGNESNTMNNDADTPPVVAVSFGSALVEDTERLFDTEEATERRVTCLDDFLGVL